METKTIILCLDIILISPFYSNFSNLMFPRSYVVSFSILSKGNSNKHAKHIEKKKKLKHTMSTQLYKMSTYLRSLILSFDLMIKIFI